MRIIAGEFRGRRLLPPESVTTRPITDRAKQSLFDILSPLLPGAGVYDCFAGTGSMGLEALSRGAAEVSFFEADRSALIRLRKNIDALDVADRCRVIAGDLFKWFAARSPDRRAHVIFLDPPYRFLVERRDKLLALADRIAEDHLAADGIVVFRHDTANRLAFPSLPAFDVRTYGRMAIELLRPVSQHEKEGESK